MSDLPLYQLIAAGLLIYAAARDVATRLIPDAVPIALLGLGVGYRVLTVGWAGAGVSLFVGCLIFAALLVLAMRGWLGGGDVKLVAALSTGLTLDQVWPFVVATVFSGGVLGVVYIIGRYVVPETRVAGGGSLVRRVLAVEAWRVRRRGPLPYAVAIAIGGLFVLSTLTRV